ncbi:MAG: hypothetical protein KJ066_21100 [Acidobacteria bacterium]|nr:hypothetical protein [Acidobacteriota bacterium]
MRRAHDVRAMFDAEADAERRAHDERALATLRDLGCTLSEVALPDGDLSYYIGSSGSPSGVMLAGRLYGDGDLLALARAFERASPRATRYPPGFEPGG